MAAAGVPPNEVTYNTLLNLAGDYAEGRKVLAEMAAAGVPPDAVTYSTLLNLAGDYAEGRKVLAEMVAAGVPPDEVGLTTLVRKAPSFEQGCAFAMEARHSHGWYTGRGFYQALFSLPIDHLDAGGLMEIYNSLPFKHETALENPIRQYRRERRPEEAMRLCLFAPHLPAAQKFYRDRYEFCRSYLLSRLDIIADDDNCYYCLGIAAHANRDWELARKNLAIALDRAYATPRIDHIERMLRTIP
jgi:hypothetical protein